MFYSASERGFYSRDIHGENIPKDAVEISDELHASLIVGQSAGKVISADESGVPCLTDPPPATEEELKLMAIQKRDALLAAASQKIAPLQFAVDLNEATDSEKTALVAWKRYSVDLNRITQQDGFPSDVAWPEQPSEDI